MKQIKKTTLTAMVCASLIILSGCESSDGSGVAGQYMEDDGTNLQSTPTGTLEDEATDLVIPDGTNLRINYADPSYELVATPEFILQQWNGMKQCLQVEVPDGYILVEREVIPPEDATQILQMPGQAFASALDREFDVFIQIQIDDFSLDNDDRGYYFRQVIGPYMWRFNDLDPRTYDPNCSAFIVR